MKKVIFVFSGFGGKLLGKTEKVIRKNLERCDTTLHFLSNTNKDLFISGGDDFSTADDLVAFLKHEVKAHDEALSLCASGGGFGGICHSAAAGVKKIIGFSSFTRIDPEARKVDKRGQKLHQFFDEQIPDVRMQNTLWHLHANSFEGKIWLVYPADNKADRYQAENLRNTRGVTLIPMPSENHGMSDCPAVPFAILNEIESTQAETYADHLKFPENNATPMVSEDYHYYEKVVSTSKWLVC